MFSSLNKKVVELISEMHIDGSHEYALLVLVAVFAMLDVCSVC